MAEPRFVFDATPDNFRTLVLANSEKGPVAVNFWSPRAGPCLMLMPRLLRLAEESGGRFLLARLNTGEFGRLARDWGVTSIPATKIFRHGKVVDTLHGAESEASVRALLAHAGFLGAARYRLAAVRLTLDDYEGAMARRTTACSRFSRCSESRMHGYSGRVPSCIKSPPDRTHRRRNISCRRTVVPKRNPAAGREVS